MNPAYAAHGTSDQPNPFEQPAFEPKTAMLKIQVNMKFTMGNLITQNHRKHGNKELSRAARRQSSLQKKHSNFQSQEKNGKISSNHIPSIVQQTAQCECINYVGGSTLILPCKVLGGYIETFDTC